MSEADRQLFVNTYVAVSSPGHPLYSQYLVLIGRHAIYINTIHVTQWFLPWHRWFMNAMEELLNEANCNVTIPWWDSAKTAGSPWTFPPFGSASDMIGTSGSPCVTDGGFASPAWAGGGTHGCLSRGATGSLPTSLQENQAMSLNATQYGNFSDMLQIQVHNMVHQVTGGTMYQPWSVEDPEFFLFHGHIDKLWNDWQARGDDYFNAYPFPLDSVMPVSNENTPRQWNSLKATGVMYSRVGGTGQVPSGASALCHVIRLSPTTIVDIDVLQSAIANATPAILLQIPQLGAPHLPDDPLTLSGNETMKIAQKRNAALMAMGTFRTLFENPIDQALGFDVATTVVLLNVSTISTAPPTPHSRTSARRCASGMVYCDGLKQCIGMSEACPFSLSP